MDWGKKNKRTHLCSELAGFHADLGPGAGDHVEEIFALLRPLGDVFVELSDFALHTGSEWALVDVRAVVCLLGARWSGAR